MLESLIGKVNMKRLILSVIAMFVFIFASDFVIHSLNFPSFCGRGFRVG